MRFFERKLSSKQKVLMKSVAISTISSSILQLTYRTISNIDSSYSPIDTKPSNNMNDNKEHESNINSFHPVGISTVPINNSINAMLSEMGVAALCGAGFGLLVGYLLLRNIYPSSEKPESAQKLDRSVDRLQKRARRLNATSSGATISTDITTDQQNILLTDNKSLSLASEFYCPITKEIMNDPVIADDGHSYEREALQEWYDNGNLVCPVNPNIQLSNPEDMPTNQALLRQIVDEVTDKVSFNC